FSKRSVSRAPRPIGWIPRSAPDFRSDSQTHNPSAAVGKSSNPASPVYPVRVTRNEARPPATEGSPRGGTEARRALDFPHPSISGGTARGWAPQGAGGTKSSITPAKGLTRLKSTDVKRWSSSGARGPWRATQSPSNVRSMSTTSSVAWALSHDHTAARGPALQTSRNRSGARHVTITSSRIVPSSRSRCVYRALPESAGTMGLFRELRYELSSLIFGLGILAMIFSLTRYLIPTQSPDWLKSIHNAVGDYVVWEAFFGFLAVLGGGFYFVDTIRKEREFERLISTASKEVFVKNMGRIEELTYDHLPSAYERRFLDKKREFRIKG